MTAMLLVLFLACDAMWAGYAWSMPVPYHREAFFGVNVGAGRPDACDKRTLLTYRVALLISFTLIEAVATFLTVRNWSVLNVTSIRLLTYAVLTVVGLTHYVVCARTVKPHKSSDLICLASPLSPRRLSNYTSLALEAFVVGGTLGPLALIACYYGSIPALVPLGLHGEFAGKSFRLVFGGALIALYLQVFVFILKLGMVRATIALRSEHASTLLNLKEESIRTYARMWDMFRAGIALAAILNLRVLVRTEEQAAAVSKIGMAFGLVAGAIAVVTFLRMMTRLSRLFRAVKSKTGQVYVARPTDQGHWHAGGLIYYNPADAALFVETPVRAGYSTSYALNFGNWLAFPIFIYLAALPAVMGWYFGVL